MKSVRILLLLAAFQLEVRVRASADSGPLWQPQGCAKTQTECHVQTGTMTLKLKSSAGHVDVGANSILERKTGTWKILTGAVRVRESEIETVYGDVEKTDGEAWVIAETKDRVVVRAVEGAIHFRSRDGRLLEIPQGLEIWIGSVDSEGRALHGVPVEISIADHLRRLVQMDQLNKSKLKERLAELRERWKGREFVASDLYDQIAKRTLASIAESEREEAKKRTEAKQVRDHYRQMLYRTAFEK